MKHKSSHIFWGLIFVVVGLFLLGNNLGLIQIEITWGKIWPSVLILIGISWIIDSIQKK
jgi:hypothetical protein